MIEVSSDIALHVHADSSQGARSEVLIRGQRSGTLVPGSVLEAALRTDSGWLLFLTHDVPYEEMLSIYLLSDAGGLLDSATIGGPYASGSFRGLRTEPPATVHFNFIDNADWHLRVLDRPRLTLPWWPDARGVWRGGRLRRSFVIGRAFARRFD